MSEVSKPLDYLRAGGFVVTKVERRRRVRVLLDAQNRFLTHPGLTTIQVIPRGARSTATLRMTMFTAALELR